MNKTLLKLLWQDRGAPRAARTAVSLHSHTMHSEEPLGGIPRYAGRVPGLSRSLPREDYSRLYWTPPLPARQALELERRQIEDGLGLHGLVSLTDHDNIGASDRLRLLESTGRVLVSFEWTVPLRPSFLHLGIHNLPETRAQSWVQELIRAAQGRSSASIGDLLEWLNELPGCLVVLNHPLWDEPGAGEGSHLQMAQDFLASYGRWVHALEWNGLRPWAENRAVMRMAEEHGLPVVAGGDRHGVTPNTVLNLTDARTFEEFAAEVRGDRRSTVLVLPSYRGPHLLRWIECAAEVLREYPSLAGRERWCDRVFCRQDDGSSEPLGENWTEWFPEGLRVFSPAMVLLHRGLRVRGSSGWTGMAPRSS